MIFETLDIMEGVDGMLELDFIVVDGTSAKTFTYMRYRVEKRVTQSHTAVWKFGNFPATQILREINFCESGVSKSTISTVLVPLKVSFSEFLHFVRAEID